MQKVSDEEVKSEYEGTHVALESMNTFYGLVNLNNYTMYEIKTCSRHVIQTCEMN